MEFIYLEEIDSTNKYVKEHLSEINDKSIVYTYNQTCGYGRLNRSWYNSSGNALYLSFVLKDSNVPNELFPNFTQYLSVIVSNLLNKHYNINSEIKWPNDILINKKKIAGILAESVLNKGNLSALILGIGINLNSNESDMNKIDKPSTSLYLETGDEIDKDLFLKRLSNDFFLLYDDFIREGFSYIKNDYIKRISFLDKQISMNVLGDIHCGIAKGITDNGSLILLEHNEEKIYYIGDIL